MFKRDAELQVLMSDFSWTKNVVQFLVSVYNTQLNFNNSISLKKCVLYTENYVTTYCFEFGTRFDSIMSALWDHLIVKSLLEHTHTVKNTFEKLLK